ncbi:centriolar and ciliogenesis-associated protein HYLS1-like [Leptopilina boulardi]|uniref:centriolar and ciliogenesis-associated protein HYLS1-like n=1 Tax=Leptopilina boulardi TaxID=63433 RepID=UPI0021F69913|nr:centriolar and ciliogenesis-associated protein HYLS1-like [Leptopilina boulardi]
MAEVKDDPSEVLSILNSLGFVGVTASQLKSFMKDLKLYRKIKEREREAWKEEIKRKILTKQKQSLVEFIEEQEKSTKYSHSEKTILPETPRKTDAMVKVKVKYSPRDTQNAEKENFRQSRSNTQRSDVPKERECDFWMKNLFQNDHKQICASSKTASSRDYTNRSKSESKESSTDGLKKSRMESSKEYSESVSCLKSREKIEKIERKTPRICEKFRAQKRPASASESNPKILHLKTKSTLSDPGESISCSVTRTSVSSQPKSFIRPWRLQPDAQKPWKKSDPVTLYQKYQEEWKQFPLPGEDKHLDVRWAIRERMMGCDPHPRPADYKSSHLLALKKR